MFVNIVQFPPLAPGKEHEFEAWFAWTNALYEPFEGFVSRRLLKPIDGSGGNYLAIVEHESRETFMAMHASVERQQARRKVEPFFRGSPQPRFYEVVLETLTRRRRRKATRGT